MIWADAFIIIGIVAFVVTIVFSIYMMK